jgi:hypothetical protein
MATPISWVWRSYALTTPDPNKAVPLLNADFEMVQGPATRSKASQSRGAAA